MLDNRSDKEKEKGPGEKTSGTARRRMVAE
jgi:hypothetical protein